jgi:hypothetical protein
VKKGPEMVRKYHGKDGLVRNYSVTRTRTGKKFEDKEVPALVRYSRARPKNDWKELAYALRPTEIPNCFKAFLQP